MGMNPKFFDVKKEKQDAIINAALKVFAENGYRKASTDVMVREAGISKGLLFHYFISKQGVYEFVYDYSVKYMMLELSQSVRKGETDFFTIQRMIEACKTRVMKNYPYMQQFLTGVKYETHPDALRVLRSSDNSVEETYNNIYKKVDMSRFAGNVDIKKVIRMIGWMSDGYIKDKFMEGTPDLDEMNLEFSQYIAMLRERFYGGVIKEDVKPIDLEPITEDGPRDDSVMDSMRQMAVADLLEEAEAAEEPSFEERLALGKKSAYYSGSDMVPEEEAEEAELTEAAETAESVPVEETEEIAAEAEVTKDTEDTTEEIVAEAEEKTGEEAEEPAAESDVEAFGEAKETSETAEEMNEAEAETAKETEEVEEAEEAEAEALKEAEETSEAAEEAEETEALNAEETSGVLEGAEKAEEAAEADTEEDEDLIIKGIDEALAKSLEADETEGAGDGEGKDKEEREGKKNKKRDKKRNEDKEIREVTISIDDFTEKLRNYENYSYGSDIVVYAASSTVNTYIPDADVKGLFDGSRLGDFTYGSDSRGGRGIPYDSSDNIQIFVDENDDEPAAPDTNAVNTNNSDDFDIGDLSDKIMSNTARQSKDHEYRSELEGMGPAPVLPDFSPEKIRKMNDRMDDDNEDSHMYRPVKF